MREPSERDLELARKAEERIIFRLKEGLLSIGLQHVDPAPKKLAEYLALFIAKAREEGRREPRELTEREVVKPGDRDLELAQDLSLRRRLIIATARQEERERCARLADEAARLGNEDGNPDVVAAARIIARKIRRGAA